MFFIRFVHEPLFKIILAISILVGLMVWWSDRTSRKNK
jgi:hypothetical protein